MCRYVPTRLWTKDTILAAAKLCTKDTISNITNIVRTVYQGSPDSNPFSNIHREIALEIIGKVESNSMCRDLVDAWSGDAELILKAMHVDFTLIARCSNELKSNSDFIRQTVAITPDVLHYLPSSSYHYDEFVQNIVREKIVAGETSFLRYGNAAIRRDKALFFLVAKKDSKAIQYIDDSLRDDTTLWKSWVDITKDFDCIQFVSDSLKRDRTFMASLLQRAPTNIWSWTWNFEGKRWEALLGQISQKLTADTEFMIPILNGREYLLPPLLQILPSNDHVKLEQCALTYLERGGTFQPVSHLFRSNRDAVIVAVKQHGDALKHVDPQFKDDEDIVRLGIESSPLNFQYASARCRGNKELIQMAVCENGAAAKHMLLPEPIDREFVLALVRSCKTDSNIILCNLPAPIKLDHDLWIAAIPGLNPTFSLPKELGTNKNFAIRFLLNCPAPVAKKSFFKELDPSLKQHSNLKLFLAEFVVTRTTYDAFFSDGSCN